MMPNHLSSHGSPLSQFAFNIQLGPLVEVYKSIKLSLSSEGTAAYVARMKEREMRRAEREEDIVEKGKEKEKENISRKAT